MENKQTTMTAEKSIKQRKRYIMTGKEYMEILNLTEQEWMELCFKITCDLMEANSDVLQRLKEWQQD